MSFQISNSDVDNSEDGDIIALFNEKNRTGISVFDSVSQTIFITSVVESEPQDYQNLIKFLMINSYFKVILPQKPPKELLETILCVQNEQKKSKNRSEEEQEESKQLNLEESSPNFVIYMKKSDFEAESTITHLLTLDYTKLIEESNMDGLDLNTLDKKGKMCFLKTIIDLDNIPMIKSLGGLLNFLFQTNQINKSFRVDKIKMKQPSKNVYITMKTYNSLSIFREDIHPSQIKGKGRSKEGFSLFNLFDSCISTAHGRKLLKSWFLNPTYDNSILEERLYTVEFFLEKFSLQEFDKVKKALTKNYDLAVILKKFQAGTSSKDHWKKLKYSLENFILIRNLFFSMFDTKKSSSHAKTNPIIVSKIMEFDVETIVNLSKVFTMCLTFKDSSEKFTINSGISEELDELRKIYGNLTDILTFYAHQEMDRIPEGASIRLSISYLPYFGYLVTIPKDKTDNENPNEISKASSKNLSDSPEFGLQQKRMRDFIGKESFDSKDYPFRRNKFLSQIEEENSQEEDMSQPNNLNHTFFDGSFQERSNSPRVDHQEDSMNVEEPKHPHAVSFTVSGDLKKIAEMIGWEIKFETKDCFYFKSVLTAKLDEGFGDIGGQIADIEHEILLQIESEVLEHIVELSLLADLIAELDCYFCYTLVAKKFGLSRPIISTQTCFMIQNGRHLLSEVAGENGFKPNNYFVYNYIDDYDKSIKGSENEMINSFYSNKCVILTGPNFSGKSIYLKQIGLITFMCHIGSFVPATACKIGLVDKILTMIHLSDTINEDSGIGEELQDLGRIFRLATNKSLILIDEFAKNINYESGLACTLSLVTYLTRDYFKTNNQIPLDQNHVLNDQNQLYERIPTSIIVTHYNAIFHRNLLKESYLLRFFTMEALLQRGNQSYLFVKDKTNSKISSDPNLHYINMAEGLELANPEKDHRLIFLYKVKPGFSIRSFAIFCAKQVGFSQDIIKRINDIHRSDSKKADPLQALLTKYEGATRDLLYRINDIFCSIKKSDEP